jgi:hypothetical protein
MQVLGSRRVLQTMTMSMRLAPAPLLRSPASFWFRKATYRTPSSFSIRSASTSSGAPEEEKTHVFVIWAPDYTDKDALARRLAVRDQHLQGTKPGQEAGYYCGRFVVIICLKLIPLQCSAVPSSPLSRLSQQTLLRKWRDHYYSSEQSLSKRCEQI